MIRGVPKWRESRTDGRTDNIHHDYLDNLFCILVTAIYASVVHPYTPVYNYLVLFHT